MSSAELTTAWATNMWAMIADGGVWGVPRSGLMYRKQADAKRLALYARMPWVEGMPASREELREAQDSDHEGIVRVFQAIGVEVVDETHSRKVDGNEKGTG